MASSMRSRTHGSSVGGIVTSTSVHAPVAAAAASLSTAPLLEVGESTPGGSTPEPTAVRPGGGKAAAAATAACLAPALLLDAAGFFVPPTAVCCCSIRRTKLEDSARKSREAARPRGCQAKQDKFHLTKCSHHFLWLHRRLSRLHVFHHSAVYRVLCPAMPGPAADRGWL